MKIGILTYHRTLNYGACLQAIATRVVLERMGHEVYYVDYWPDYHKELYKVFNINLFLSSNLKQKLLYLYKFLFCFRRRSKKRKLWMKFIDSNISPYCQPAQDSFDLVLYGSDQIWRKQKFLNNYNEVYFANNTVNAKYHIAFSASMGDLPKTSSEKDYVKSLLSNFDYISVREKNLLEFIKQLGYKDAVQTLDPTLLLNMYDWDNIVKTHDYNGKRYVLFFPLRGGFSRSQVQLFAKERDLLFVELRPYSTNLNIGSEELVGDPTHFLYLVKNAEYVFTSSFHGLAFSLVYHRQIFASFGSNAERAISLMKMLGLEDHYIQEGNQIPNICRDIDYETVDKLLAKNQNFTKEYLQKIENIK